jgi:hypothetical protein
MPKTRLFENNTLLRRMAALILDRKADDFGEKAVILVLVVLAGVAAFSAFGSRVVDLINQATSGI